MSARKTKTKKNGDSFRVSMPSVLDSKVRALSKVQLQRKRSCLAKKLRKLGYQVDVKQLSIDIQFSSINEVPVGARYYVRQLLRMGFSKQTSLF